jgi:hypothetical protein
MSWRNERLSRRAALVGGLGLAAAIGLAAGSRTGGLLRLPPRPPETVFADALRAAVADIDDARHLGRDIITRLAIVPDPAALEAKVRDRLGVADGTTTDATVRELVRHRVADDFKAGETVLLDGWLLSLTEALVLAYVALVGDAVDADPDAVRR